MEEGEGVERGKVVGQVRLGGSEVLRRTTDGREMEDWVGGLADLKRGEGLVGSDQGWNK